MQWRTRLPGARCGAVLQRKRMRADTAGAPLLLSWKRGEMEGDPIMPYIIAWLLGVPALVLILIWLFMH